MNICSTYLWTLLAAVVLLPTMAKDIDPVVPFDLPAAGLEQGVRDLRRLNKEFGIRKILVTGCPGLSVRLGGWEQSDKRYEEFGELLAKAKELLSDTDLEIGWWNSPTVTYAKGGPYQMMVGGDGRKAEHAACSLDPSFRENLARHVSIVAAKARPWAILFEDDMHFGWQRTVKKYTCYCPLHLAAVGRIVGRTVTREELVDACDRPSSGNLKLRAAFAETMRESMRLVGGLIRQAVDKVSPETIMGPCGTYDIGRDGDSLLDFARSIAGRHRPFVRVASSPYSYNQSPMMLVQQMSDCIWNYENLPDDFIRWQELDTYPHNRFFMPDATVDAMLFMHAAFGANETLFYGTQYLDAPLEQDGYFGVLRRSRKKLAALRAEVRGKPLCGVQILHRHSRDDLRRYDRTPGLEWGTALLARYGMPFTTREMSAKLLVGAEADRFTDQEARELLSRGGVLLDGDAAARFSARGMDDLIGAHVVPARDLPAAFERLLPAAGTQRLDGRKIYNYAFAAAGTEASVGFCISGMKNGAETLLEFVGIDGRGFAPAAIRYENEAGGRVGILASGLVGNESSSIYSMRKKEMIRVLFAWLGRGDLPVVVADEPNVLITCNRSVGGGDHVLTIVNLRMDVLQRLELILGREIQGRPIEELGENGHWHPSSFDGPYYPGIARVFRVSGEYDLVIYGGTSAGIAAGIKARRQGLSAVVLEPTERIGGLTTGGLGQTDIGNKSAFKGVALEFYRDIARYYRDPAHWKWQKRDEYMPDGQCASSQNDESMWTFEPSAALEVLERWERENRLEIRRGERLDRSPIGVKKDATGRILSLRTESGKIYCGKVFVDATYEGDLLAAAGVSYVVGRESNAQYGETLNGSQPNQGYHKLSKGVDPYVVKGDRTSGLLPGVDDAPLSADGTGDDHVQAYCFRMCLTDVPENRIPFEKPKGYDERNYELLLRNLEAGPLDSLWFPPYPWINSKMPNRKTDTNNRTGVSTDFIGANWEYPEASYDVRERIVRAHLDYQRGLMWTLANHPRVPEYIRKEASKWGTCRDEFLDGYGDGWQRQLYVREARRMIGEYVMTEHECRHDRVAPKPIAKGAYGMDSHHTRRCVDAAGFAQNEGDVEVGCEKGPYGIAYGSIVPRRSECVNLLVPVCLSASHIAFGSIRMEPVFFSLGEAAAAAAVLSVRDGVAVQDVDYKKLLKLLD